MKRRRLLIILLLLLFAIVVATFSMMSHPRKTVSFGLKQLSKQNNYLIVETEMKVLGNAVVVNVCREEFGIHPVWFQTYTTPGGHFTNQNGGLSSPYIVLPGQALLFTNVLPAEANETHVLFDVSFFSRSGTLLHQVREKMNLGYDNPFLRRFQKLDQNPETINIQADIPLLFTEETLKAHHP